MDYIKKILYIRTDRMGDVLMNLPALSVLRKSYKQAAIDLVVDKPLVPLFDGHPAIDHVWGIAMSKWKKGFVEKLKFINRLRQERYDIAVVSNPDKWMHAAMFFACIPLRVGYNRKWGFLLNKKIPDEKGDAIYHEIDYNLRLVRLISGEHWDGAIELPLDEGSRVLTEVRMEEMRIGQKPVIAVHPGSSNPGKRWNVKKFASLCDAIADGLNFQVVLIGGTEERELCRAVALLCRTTPVNLAGELSLKELVAFFSRPFTEASVSVDSGPAHVSWICGTPVVALYAKNVVGSNPVRWGPRDEKSRTIFKPIDDISVEEVYDELKKILRGDIG